MPPRSTNHDASQWVVPALLLGVVCGFGLTMFALKVAVWIGLVVAVAALVRRRADSGGMFALGFVLGIAAYMAIAVFAVLQGGGESDGSRA